jgi:hypothetical protein
MLHNLVSVIVCVFSRPSGVSASNGSNEKQRKIDEEEEERQCSQMN